MVNWPVTKSTMSLAKSIKQTTTGLSLTKKSCNPNHHHHHHLALNSSSSHATPSITTTQHSSHKSHHLSQTQHVTTHRSHGTHSSTTPSSSSSSPQMSINKHLFSAKPKDSIFDQEDVNRICNHVKFNKMDIKNHENGKENHEKQGTLLIDHEINDDSLNNNNQMIKPKINTNSSDNKNEINYKEKDDQEEKQDKKEQDEDYINSQLIKRCPNAMNEIMTMTRSKSMHDISTNNHEIEPILTTQRSWPFGSINQDNNYNNNNMDKFSCNNIVPGGISMNNINKFQKEQDDDINNNVEEYGNQNRIKIKHSPWEKNIDWNCVNITL